MSPGAQAWASSFFLQDISYSCHAEGQVPVGIMAEHLAVVPQHEKNSLCRTGTEPAGGKQHWLLLQALLVRFDAIRPDVTK